MLENDDLLNLNDIFGPIFSLNPRDFQFLPGDKKMIKQLAEYIKKTIDNNDFTYFKRKSKKRVPNCVITTPLGRFYRKSINKNNWLSENSQDNNGAKDANLEEKLFDRVFKLLLPYDDAAKQFSKDMVNT